MKGKTALLQLSTYSSGVKKLIQYVWSVKQSAGF